VDAGAHIGCASVWLGSRYPNAKIIAIEPDRENFELLEHNIDRYPNITAIHGALWGRHGNLALMDPGHGSWGYRVKEDVDSDEMIPAVTIDDILMKFDLCGIDVLKVDIEGAEVEVFRSSETWIDRVDAIIIELDDRHTPGCSIALFRATEDFDIEMRRGENLALMRTPAGRTSGGEARNVAARLTTDP
jgi:FkbM family methyltransferase